MISLVVNCYERTYRHVLREGFFKAIEADNQRSFGQRIALINNVADPLDAADRASALVASGEIDRFEFVAANIGEALRMTGLPKRILHRHPYFLDYGLVMPLVADGEWLLGWDAEVRLVSPADWISPALRLLASDERVFSAAPNWPERTDPDGALHESVDRAGDFLLNLAFSDQVFLVRRAHLCRPIFRRFAPASWARNAPHPWSFEARVEAYQRAERRFRATHEWIRYTHNDTGVEITDRVGQPKLTRLQERLLNRARRYLGTAPEWVGPRFHIRESR